MQPDGAQVKPSVGEDPKEIIVRAKREAAAIVDKARSEGAAQASSLLEVSNVGDAVMSLCSFFPFKAPTESPKEIRNEREQRATTSANDSQSTIVGCFLKLML